MSTRDMIAVGRVGGLTPEPWTLTLGREGA